MDEVIRAEKLTKTYMLGDVPLQVLKGVSMTVPKGELIYRDGREVLTRNWVWRQCEKDKATERTKNIFIPIDVLGDVGKTVAETIIEDLSSLIPRYLGGTIFSALLDRENVSCPLPGVK